MKKKKYKETNSQKLDRIIARLDYIANNLINEKVKALPWDRKCIKCGAILDFSTYHFCSSSLNL